MNEATATQPPPAAMEPNRAAGYPVSKGWIFGFLGGMIVMMILNTLVYKVPKEWSWVNLIFAMGVGIPVGVAIQLRSQKRYAEIAPFVRGHLIGIGCIIPLILLAMVGQHYYGELGWWLTLVVGFAVGILAVVAWKKLRRNAKPQ
jgi:uncharacterized membrane protein YdjX (TVP38/TMEM64 family)